MNEIRKIKIKKIVLKLSNTSVELTVEEAKELKEELDKLFNGYGYPVYIPQYPIWPQYSTGDFIITTGTAGMEADCQKS